MAGVFLGHKTFTTDNNDSNWLQMDNIFSDKFSAYEIHFYDYYTQGDTSANQMRMNLIDSTGAVKSDSEYYSTRQYGRSNADGRQTPIAYDGLAYWVVSMGCYDDFSANTIMVMHTPFESDRITSFYNTDIGTTTEIYTNSFAGTYETNASITGFRIYSGDNAEEMKSLNVSIFGVGK